MIRSQAGCGGNGSDSGTRHCGSGWLLAGTGALRVYISWLGWSGMGRGGGNRCKIGSTLGGPKVQNPVRHYQRGLSVCIFFPLYPSCGYRINGK